MTVVKDGLQQYIKDIERYDLLTKDEERELARLVREENSVEARQRLITANLRFVIQVANKFRAYASGGKYTLLDLIQEGNTGLIHAVTKFDERKGYRFITYASWWIKARMMSFIVRSHSVVRIGTTSAERKLFFKLGEIKTLTEVKDQGERAIARKALAIKLKSTPSLIAQMEDRVSWNDVSVDAPIKGVTFNASLHDFIADEEELEEKLTAQNLKEKAREDIERALNKLTAREQDILRKRYLQEETMTLQAIATIYSLSRERIRQLEVRALAKVKKSLLRSKASKELRG